MRATISAGLRQRPAQSGARAYLENRPRRLRAPSRTKRCGANACAAESNHVTTVSMSVPPSRYSHSIPRRRPDILAKGRASRLPRRKPIFAGPGARSGHADGAGRPLPGHRNVTNASTGPRWRKPRGSSAFADGFLQCPRPGGLLHLDAGGAHHLAPLFGFFGQQPAAAAGGPPAARRRARQCAPWPWDRPARR